MTDIPLNPATPVTNGDIVKSTNALPVYFATASALPNGTTATTQAAGDNTAKVATDQFVTTAIANAIAGVNPAVAVQAATTTSGNTSGLTYLNGAAGIGATLTGVANTALVVDGFTFTAINQRLLVKNDMQSPSGAFNGVYFVTQIQTAIVPIILTRALDYDQPSDINNTGAIPVVNGTVNALTSWLLTSSVTTVGTDPLTYAQFSYAPSSVAAYSEGTWTPVIAGSTTAGTQTYTIQEGTYARVGNTVTIWAAVKLATIDAGIAGNVSITGLPFVARTVASASFPVVFCNVGLVALTASYTWLTGRILTGASTINVQQAGSGQANADVPVSGIGVNTVLVLSATYPV